MERPRGSPIPISTGEERALTNPTISEPTMAPGIEPMVPRTMTAKEGSRRVKAVSGVNLRVIAKMAPPIPEIPADKNALVSWMRSTLIPLLAARSGLSATALILRPRRVFLSRISRRMTEEKTRTGIAPL